MNACLTQELNGYGAMIRFMLLSFLAAAFLILSVPANAQMFPTTEETLGATESLGLGGVQATPQGGSNNTLTGALAQIKTMAFSGFGLLEATADDILWSVWGWALFMGLMAFLIRPSGDWSEAVSPIMRLGFILFLIAGLLAVFDKMSMGWLDFMMDTGTYAGGEGTGQESLEDISAIVWDGFSRTGALMAGMGGINILIYPGDFFMLAALAGLVLGVHCLLAFRLFKLFGGFYILSVIAFLLVPFWVWRGTTFMALGSTKYIIGSGIAAGAMAMGYALVGSMVGEIYYDPAGDMGTMFMPAVAMGMLLLIVAGLGQTVLGVITGNPDGGGTGEVRNMFWMATAAAGLAGAAGRGIAAGVNALKGAGAGAGSGIFTPSGITMNTMNTAYTGRASSGSPVGVSGFLGRRGP